MDTVELTHDNGSGTSVRMARSLSRANDGIEAGVPSLDPA